MMMVTNRAMMPNTSEPIELHGHLTGCLTVIGGAEANAPRIWESWHFSAHTVGTLYLGFD
jgi:hypothetical protein